MKVLTTFVLLSVAAVGAACGSGSTPANATANANANTNSANPAGNSSAANQTASPLANTTGNKPPANTAEPANAGKAERVQFAAGEEDGSWTRDIPAEGSIDFLVNAKQGQTFGFQVGYEGKASDIQAFLTEPGLQDITIQTGPEARKEFKTKKSGDHRITVNNMSKKKVTMTLYVDIR